MSQQNIQGQAEQANKRLLNFYFSFREIPQVNDKIQTFLYHLEEINKQIQTKLIGTTEQQDGSSNPNFSTPIEVELIFEREQKIKIELYQMDSNEKNSFIGEAQTTVSSIFGSSKIQIVDLLKNNKKVGNILILVEVVHQIHQILKMSFSAQNIPNNKYFWQTTNPQLKFYRFIGDYGQEVFVHETEVIQNSLHPDWKEINFNLQNFCKGDKYMPIKVQLWDYQKGNNHLLGETTFTLNEIQEADIQKKEWKKKIRNKAKNQQSDASLIVRTFQLKNQYNFESYRQGGLELNLLIAIDFTESNKLPTDPQSLHYLDPNKKQDEQTSPYLDAIKQVCKILIDYDDDKKVAMYGFGCSPKMQNICPNKTVHFFHLNDNVENPDVQNIDGILQCYFNALPHLRFSGPTLLHEILTKAMDKAKKCKEEGSDVYQILLVLTDGQIDDMGSAIDDIFASSHLPLSVIIIGIGDADFKKMEILDNNDLCLVDSLGRKSQRDLVYFASFKKYQNDPQKLAEEVLREVPRQVEEYMMLIDKVPNFQNNQASQNRLNTENRNIFS